MTPDQTKAVLAKCAAYDQRTVGHTDVLAWHDAIGDLDYTDALTAVTRYYRDNRDRIYPADVRQQVLAIRNDRAQTQPHEIRALPSRFEADAIRDQRVRENVARLAEAWSTPTEASGDPHAAALARAKRERRERGTKPPAPKQRRDAKPIDLAKIPGPAWADPDARERAAVAALHDSNRACGRPACGRCRTEAA